MFTVRTPGSSANLGPGFDTLGLALDLTLDVTVGGAGPFADEHHPAVRAFRAAGGEGPISVRSAIPAARGLGFSGAARVAGATAALVAAGMPVVEARERAIPIAADLEGHADNVAAAALGGCTVAAAGLALGVPLAFEPVVVVWIPSQETSTKQSRRSLPTQVPFTDAVFNVGRTALLVAALASGHTEALRTATEDRLHQSVRLERVPGSAAAIDAALAGGALAAWLSGSGPTVAALSQPGAPAETVQAALARHGTTRVLAVDRQGTRLVEQPEG